MATNGEASERRGRGKPPSYDLNISSPRFLIANRLEFRDGKKTQGGLGRKMEGTRCPFAFFLAAPVDGRNPQGKKEGTQLGWKENATSERKNKEGKEGEKKRRGCVLSFPSELLKNFSLGMRRRGAAASHEGKRKKRGGGKRKGAKNPFVSHNREKGGEFHINPRRRNFGHRTEDVEEKGGRKKKKGKRRKRKLHQFVHGFTVAFWAFSSYWKYSSPRRSRTEEGGKKKGGTRGRKRWQSSVWGHMPGERRTPIASRSGPAHPALREKPGEGAGEERRRCCTALSSNSDPSTRHTLQRQRKGKRGGEERGGE